LYRDKLDRIFGVSAHMRVNLQFDGSVPVEVGI